MCVTAVVLGQSLKSLSHRVILWLPACAYKHSLLWILSFKILFWEENCNWDSLSHFRDKVQGKDKAASPSIDFSSFSPPLSTHTRHIITEKNTVLQPCRLHGVHSSLLSYISNHIYDHLQPTIKKKGILYITVCSQLKAFNCLLIDKCRSAIISSNAGQFWGWTHC